MIELTRTSEVSQKPFEKRNMDPREQNYTKQRSQGG